MNVGDRVRIIGPWPESRPETAHLVGLQATIIKVSRSENEPLFVRLPDGHGWSTDEVYLPVRYVEVLDQ